MKSKRIIKSRKSRTRIKRRTRKIGGMSIFSSKLNPFSKKNNREVSVTPEEIVEYTPQYNDPTFKYTREPDQTKFIFKNNKLNIEKNSKEGEFNKTVTKTIILPSESIQIWKDYSKEYQSGKANKVINGVMNSTYKDWQTFLIECEKITPEETKTVRTYIINGNKKDMIIETNGKAPIKTEYKNGQPVIVTNSINKSRNNSRGQNLNPLNPRQISL